MFLVNQLIKRKSLFWFTVVEVSVYAWMAALLLELLEGACGRAKSFILWAGSKTNEGEKGRGGLRERREEREEGISL
jgi:hypothetical protein